MLIMLLSIKSAGQIENEIRIAFSYVVASL